MHPGGTCGLVGCSNSGSDLRDREKKDIVNLDCYGDENTVMILLENSSISENTMLR